MAEVIFGYKASAEQFGPRELVELAVVAEESGMDTVALSDHFQPWRHHGGHAPFSLSCLSAIGERTDHIQLGTSVLTPLFRYNPIVIAQAFATLGCLYPGRIFLGIGTGEALNEISAGWAGDWPAFSERYERISEAIDLIRQLWSGESISFSGRYYQAQDAVIYDLPSIPIPIYLAAGGPRIARYAGRCADGLICTSGKGHHFYTDKILTPLKEGIAVANRNLQSFARIIEIKLSYDPDIYKARENTRFWAPLALSPQQKSSLGSVREIEQAAEQLSLEQIGSRWIISADPEWVVQQIMAYVHLGFNHLLFHAPGCDQRRFLSLFASDIAPRLKKECAKTG